MRELAGLAVCALIACAGMGCSADSAAGPGAKTNTIPDGLAISNALAASIPRSSDLVYNSSNAASSVAYLSAAPGAFPLGVAASVRNKTTTGTAQSITIVDGGFDPVGIAATAGDELLFSIVTVNGPAAPIHLRVPPRRPPGVVRTSPPKGRTGVALNTMITVVFSEPVNGLTVTESTIALKRNGNPVAGKVRLSSDGITADFIPQTPLEPGTAYTLVVSTGVFDADGDALSEGIEVGFTTGIEENRIGTIVVATSTTGTSSSDLDPDGYGYSIDGAPEVPIGINGSISSSWSAGLHNVTLRGFSDNCAIAPSATQSVEVRPSAGAAVTFILTCTPAPKLSGMLAFVSTREGNPEIYVANADGTNVVRLTRSPGADDEPAWSPDGKRIAFVRDFTGPPSAKMAIYVMNADGSNLVKLTEEGLFNASPAWSPDGKSIAFSGYRDGQGGVYVVNAEDGSGMRRFGFSFGYHGYPAWSTDGKTIAFTSDWYAFDFVYDLFAASLDGSDPRQLIAGPWPPKTFYFQPAYSPDGQRLAVTACPRAWDDCYPDSRVSIANPDGSHVTELVGTSGFARPTWSPDGKVIAYSSRTCRVCIGSIRYTTVDGKTAGQIISNGYSPAWRPVREP